MAFTTGISLSFYKEDLKVQLVYLGLVYFLCSLFLPHTMVQVGYGSKGHKIHYSGPLTSSNMDQVLKDHDRQIQEAVRRARLDKAKMRRLQAEGNQITNSLFVSGR